MSGNDTSRAPSGSAPTSGQAGAIFAVFMGLAAGYSCSYGATSTTFILPLTKEFGWGRTIPSLMFSCAMLGATVASFWLGRIIERFGAARVAIASGACLAAVMAMLSQMSGSPYAAVGLGFLAGLLGAGTGVGLYVSVLPNWFDRHLGRALGISVVGQSFGAMVMPPIAVMIIAANGWRMAYVVLAAIQLTVTLGVALILARIARRPPQIPRLREAAAFGMTLSEAVRTRSFWLLEATIFFQTLGMFGMSVHMFPLYADRGVAVHILPMITIMLSLGMMVGRLISGLLLDRFDGRVVGAGLFLIGAGGIAWLAGSGSGAPPVLIYLPPVMIGLALGAETDILAYLARRLYGLAHYAAIYNRLLIAYFLGSMTGPLVVGWAFDELGSPNSALWGLASSCVLAAILALNLPRSRT